jgi:hypothetical protein
MRRNGSPCTDAALTFSRSASENSVRPSRTHIRSSPSSSTNRLSFDASTIDTGLALGTTVYSDVRDGRYGSALGHTAFAAVGVFAATRGIKSGTTSSPTPRPASPKASNAPARLPQDVAVNSKPPNALGTNRSVGRASHNQALQADIAALPRDAYGIRVNQQQVNALGQRVGINRPDLQYTLGGRRYYVEYEGLKNPRGELHKARILANDPSAIVRIETID